MVRHHRILARRKTAELSAQQDVEQNLNTISLILETEDAESETLVVYPRRLSNRRLELLYVYETRRKEGRPPPFYRYRGTAVMRVEKKPTRLIGTYYTEQGGAGTVQFAKKWNRYQLPRFRTAAFRKAVQFSARHVTGEVG